MRGKDGHRVVEEVLSFEKTFEQRLKDLRDGAETLHLRLGLEPMWPGLEPSQNPDWDLNPRG